MLWASSGGDQVVDVVLGGGHRDRRETQSAVDRHVRAIDHGRQRELVLERRLHDQAALGEPLLHPLEERALTDSRRGPVEAHVIGQHDAGAGGVGEDAERAEIGDEPDLADRPHALDRLQLIERVHRLHRDGQANPGLEPALEPMKRRGLAADGAVVAAVQEADEPEILFVCVRG